MKACDIDRASFRDSAAGWRSEVRSREACRRKE